MTSFASLLSSLGGQPAATPQPRPSNAPRPPNGATAAPAQQQALTNGTKLTSNATAGVKRKAEDQVAPERSKIVKTEATTHARLPGQQSLQPSAAKVTSSSAVTYRGTARAAGTANPARPIAKPISRPGTVSASSPPTPAPPAATNGAAKKRGFAALMERAKAASEVVKAVGPSTIKHKPVEKVSKRDKARMQEDAKLKAVGKAGKMAANDRSRSNTPMDGKPGLQKKPVEPSYKGTMHKKPVARQEFTYKGTMNKAGSSLPSAGKPGNKHSSGRSKYDGYVDWDELDDVEDDDEEEVYESDGSDMMDAGFDDMEAEETAALRAAKKEDQAALEEEERHRREKLERKKKLEALSKSAAARKKF